MIIKDLIFASPCPRTVNYCLHFLNIIFTYNYTNIDEVINDFENEQEEGKPVSGKAFETQYIKTMGLPLTEYFKQRQGWGKRTHVNM